MLKFLYENPDGKITLRLLGKLGKNVFICNHTAGFYTYINVYKVVHNKIVKINVVYYKINIEYL